jgi:phage terminase large subunit GpA-like protein
MRSFFDDRYSFMAEAQNEPEDETQSEIKLDAGAIAKRFSGRARRVVPTWGTKITAFIDVQKTLLYWLVCAWDSNTFRGSIIDYGSWPDQPGRRYFTLSDAQHTFATAFPNMGVEGQVSAALSSCESVLIGRAWQREGGGEMRISRMLIDAGYLPDVVFEHCRRSPHAATVMPSHGQPLGAKSKPMAEYAVKPGETKGFHVFLTANLGNRRAIRHAKIDVNFWKSFASERLLQPIGDPGALTLFGSENERPDHSMLADHFTVERATTVEANGRKMVEWDNSPNGQNHWWDCLVGCFAAASIEGVTLPTQGKSGGPRRRVSFAEQQRAAMEGRR